MTLKSRLLLPQAAFAAKAVFGPIERGKCGLCVREPDTFFSLSILFTPAISLSHHNARVSRICRMPDTTGIGADSSCVMSRDARR